MPTLPATVAATLNKYLCHTHTHTVSPSTQNYISATNSVVTHPSLVGKSETFTKIWYRPPPVKSGSVGSVKVPTTVDTPLRSTIENLKAASMGRGEWGRHRSSQGAVWKQYRRLLGSTTVRQVMPHPTSTVDVHNWVCKPNNCRRERRRVAGHGRSRGHDGHRANLWTPVQVGWGYKFKKSAVNQ